MLYKRNFIAPYEETLNAIVRQVPRHSSYGKWVAQHEHVPKHRVKVPKKLKTIAERILLK